MPDKMTLYYLKHSGKVKGYCTGEQTMSIYGADADEYSIIMDYIQVPYDEFIINNRDYYRVIDGELVFSK